jgi:hypothetical protein
MIIPLIITLSLSCGAPLLITVIQLLDMWILDLGSWILDLLLPHYSNISLALVLPLSSLLSSHVCYLWLIVMSICQFFFIFVIPPLSLCWLLCHLFQSPPTKSLLHSYFFLCTLRVIPPLGSMVGACSHVLIEQLCWLSSLFKAIFPLAQRQWLILLPFYVANHQRDDGGSNSI